MWYFDDDVVECGFEVGRGYVGDVVWDFVEMVVEC